MQWVWVLKQKFKEEWRAHAQEDYLNFKIYNPAAAYVRAQPCSKDVLSWVLNPY